MATVGAYCFYSTDNRRTIRCSSRETSTGEDTVKSRHEKSPSLGSGSGSGKPSGNPWTRRLTRAAKDLYPCSPLPYAQRRSLKSSYCSRDFVKRRGRFVVINRSNLASGSLPVRTSWYPSKFLSLTLSANVCSEAG
jgi:hypothetical protein